MLKFSLLWWCGLLLVLMTKTMPVSASPGLIQYYFYESQGDRGQVGMYSVASAMDGGFTIEFTNTQERQVIVCSADGTTRSWEYQRLNGRGSAKADLSDGKITIKIRLDGKSGQSVQSTADIDWFQAPDYQLLSLVGAPVGDSQQFWVIGSEDFMPRLLQAVNRGVEWITVQDRQWQAIRITVSIVGLSEAFWHNDYWYEPGSAQYLKFQGRRGSPWTPLFNMEYLRKEQR